MKRIEKKILRFLSEGAYTVEEIAKEINQKEKEVGKCIEGLFNKKLVKSRESHEDNVVIGSGIHRHTFMGMEPRCVTRYTITKKGKEALG